MRWKRPLIGIASLAALLGIAEVLAPSNTPFIAQPTFPAEMGPPRKDRIESDLQLRAELKGPKTIQAGSDPWVAVTLVNTSQTFTHRVVKPGHGSMIPTREPYVYWTATIDRGDGNWVPVPDRRRFRYCGTCLATSANWTKDAIRFHPGARLPLLFPQQFEFQQAGRVRLQAHYEYRMNALQINREFTHRALAFMAPVPPFKLGSNPVEFDVVRPLDVRVRVKGVLKVNQKTRLSDLLSISLVNVSPEPIECSSPTLSADALLGLMIDEEYQGWAPDLTEQQSSYGIKRILKPGEEVPLLGEGEFPNGLDGTWETHAKGRVKLRAVYTTTTWKTGPRIMSDWVEVRVVGREEEAELAAATPRPQQP